MQLLGAFIALFIASLLSDNSQQLRSDKFIWIFQRVLPNGSFCWMALFFFSFLTTDELFSNSDFAKMLKQVRLGAGNHHIILLRQRAGKSVCTIHTHTSTHTHTPTHLSTWKAAALKFTASPPGIAATRKTNPNSQSRRRRTLCQLAPATPDDWASEGTAAMLIPSSLCEKVID